MIRTARTRQTFILGAILAIVSPAAAATNVTEIQWADCDPTVITDPSLSCGFLQVPLDYQNASAGNGRIALVKANATTDPRMGTIFFNPGGPGGSGLEIVNELSTFLLSQTGGHYDIVSWDPRGVGLSTPGEIFCFDSLDEYSALFNGTIQVTGIEMSGTFTDPADLSALFSQSESLQAKFEETGRRCVERNGDMLKYVGTAATVRDMVAIADALDGPGSLVNYYGDSYGTLIGNVFLNMFPERVGRVILDSVTDPTIWLGADISLVWERSYVDSDKLYEGFLTGCALSGPTGCPVSTSPNQTAADVDAEVQRVLKLAHDAAFANASAPLTSGQLRYAITVSIWASIYFASSWANVSASWPEVVSIVEGESAASNLTKRASHALPFSFDSIQKRSPAPLSRRQTQSANDSPSFAEAAILCGDSADADPRTTMSDVFAGVVNASRNISPMFAATWPFDAYSCAFWPVRAAERYEGPFNHTLANDIIVMGNTYDLITPFRGTASVAAQFGEQAALVRMDGFGHTQLTQPSSCITALTQAYYTNGTLPEGKETVCPADADFEVFPGVNTQQILAALPSNLGARDDAI